MKRLAIIIAVVVAVLAVAVAAIPYVVPADYLRKKVAGCISALTGREVTFTGEPSLSIYPHLVISVDGLTVGNPKEMGTDPFITAESLHTRLQFLPLLIGEFVFDEFELAAPTIHLVVDAEGRANWDIAGGRVAKLAMEPPPVTGSDPLAARPTDVPIGHLLMTGGTILYDDLQHSTREEMTAVDLDVLWPTVSSTASGRGKLTWRGEPMEFTGLLAAPLQIIRGGTSPARFAIASTPIRASFSGRATGNRAIQLDGDGTISTPSMRRTIGWLGTPMGTGPILGAASIRGTVSIGGTKVGFDGASIELDGNTAEGSLGVDFSGPRPKVQGRLAIDRLDLSAYLEAIRADLTATGAWLIAPARLPFAEAVNADIHISAGQITVGATRVGKTEAAVAIEDSALAVSIGQTEFYTGRLEGHLRVRRDGDALSAEAEVKVATVPASLALADLAGLSVLQGTTDASFNLTARGKSWAEFASAVAGAGTLDVTDGTVVGVDLATVAYNMADPFAGPMAVGTGTTPFARLTADVTLEKGELGTSNLFLEGDDYRLSLTGHGSVLSSAIAGRAILTTSTESIPLSVDGVWRQPIIGRARITLPQRPGGG